MALPFTLLNTRPDDGILHLTVREEATGHTTDWTLPAGHHLSASDDHTLYLWHDGPDPVEAELSSDTPTLLQALLHWEAVQHHSPRRFVLAYREPSALCLVFNPNGDGQLVTKRISPGEDWRLVRSGHIHPPVEEREAAVVRFARHYTRRYDEVAGMTVDDWSDEVTVRCDLLELELLRALWMGLQEGVRAAPVQQAAD